MTQINLKELIHNLTHALAPLVRLYRGQQTNTGEYYPALLDAGKLALDAAKVVTEPPPADYPEPDPAASFAAGMSVFEAFTDVVNRDDTGSRDDLSDAYGGYDEFMRQCIRVGTLFEEWACRNIKFEALEDVWPYTLHDNFGIALAEILDYDELESFDETHCETLAASFKFPRR